MSILSFNFSVAGDKDWLKDYDEPFQIMPQTKYYLTNSNVNNYPKINGDFRESIIHTSYITRPFGGMIDQLRFQKLKELMKEYVSLCLRIKFRRLLVHLPATKNEMNNLSEGMGILIKMFNKIPNLILVLEIPSFKSGFKCDVKEYFENIVVNYF